MQTVIGSAGLAEKQFSFPPRKIASQSCLTTLPTAVEKEREREEEREIERGRERERERGREGEREAVNFKVSVLVWRSERIKTIIDAILAATAAATAM